MRRMKRRALAAALSIALGVGAQEATAQFSGGAFFFGDSLSDAGSFKPVLPPGTGKFTTNPGPIWAEILAQRYGFTAIPANQGGTDYAEGGARVAEQPGVPATPPTGTATTVTNQVSNFLAKGPVNSGALYSVWAGGNDLFFQLGLAAAGQATPAQVQANMALAATQLVQQVGRLSAAGAKYIIVWNLPDVGKTPFGVGSGQSAAISQLSSFYNSTLSAGLDALHIDLIRLNAFAFLDEAIANPNAFGLTNVTTPACTVPSLLCTSSTLVAPNAAQTYLFADTVHPTSAGHQLLADYAGSVIAAPQQMGLLAQTPVDVEQATFRTLDARMWSNVNMPRPQKKFEVYAVYDYGNYDRDDSVGGGHNHANTIVVGGDMKITEQFIAGIAFGYTEDKASFGNNAGGFTLNDATLTAYAGYGSGPWYVGATLGGGGLDYRNIRRTFALGPATRTEQSSTNGTQFIARILGGYWFNTAGNWIHGPYGRVTYQNIKVDGFAESGTSSTAMSFGDQKYDPISTSLGWQVSGTLGILHPFGRASWEYIDNKNRTVTAGLVSWPGQFSLPAFKFDNNYALFEIGASANLGGNFVGFIGLSATAGNNTGNYQAITVGIRTPL